MRVLEVKNNLVKIAYDVKDNVVLSGFVIIEDENTPYVAQVMNLKADVTSNFAIVKLLFTFNEEGILKNYDGSIPSVKASVSVLPANELLDILPVENPITLGTLAQQQFSLKVDESIFKKNLVVCSNNQENTNILIDNFLRQISDTEQKIVIFDIKGEFGWEKKIHFGTDFKLPLNYNTINYIYDHDLDDIDATSRAIIQDIFIELQEYTKTLPEGFLPFDTFFTVVDQQYKETGITQLVLLKNKLLKYKEAEVFAQNLKDVLNLSIAIEKSNTIVIDISPLSPKLQNETIKYVYDVMAKIDAPIYSFVKAENGNITKKLINRIIHDKNNIYTTIICGHEFKYLPELKQYAENMILFAPQTLQHDFASYNTFLNKLNPDEFIAYGNLTQNIPLIVKLDRLDLEDNEEEEDTSEEDGEAEDALRENHNTETVPMPQIISQENSKPEVISPEKNVNENSSDEIILQDEPELEIDENIQENIILEQPVEETTVPKSDNIEVSEVVEPPKMHDEEQVVNIPETATGELETSQIPEQEVPQQIQEDDIIIQNNNLEPDLSISVEPLIDETPVIEEEIIDNEPIIETIDEPQIVEEEVITPSVAESQIEILEEVPEIEEPESITLPEEAENTTFEELVMPENDELTEDDLNFLDGISQENQLDENISTEEILNAVDEVSQNFETETNQNYNNSKSLPEPEFIQEEEQVPVVPIYPSDDLEDSQELKFEAGDEVTHPKYGRGVVEKMIKYGNKTLYSVSFHASGIGRRLLDPMMTELRKI